MSRNTLSEPQPDSASYRYWDHKLGGGKRAQKSAQVRRCYESTQDACEVLAGWWHDGYWSLVAILDTTFGSHVVDMQRCTMPGRLLSLPCTDNSKSSISLLIVKQILLGTHFHWSLVTSGFSALVCVGVLVPRCWCASVSR